MSAEIPNGYRLPLVSEADWQLPDETRQAIADNLSDPGTPEGASLSATFAPLADGMEALVAKLDHAEAVTVAAFGDSTFAGRAGTWIPRLLRNLAERWVRFDIENRAWSDVTEVDYYATQLVATGRGSEAAGDDFTYTGDINAHAPSIAGGNWVAPAGVWTADGSGAVAGSSSSTRARTEGSVTGDRRFTARVKFTADTGAAATFIALYPACTDDSNELEVRITFNASGSPALALYTRIAGTFTQVGANIPVSSIANPSATQRDLTVNVQIDGTTVRVTVAEITAVYTLSAPTAAAVAAMTKIGFRSTLIGTRVVNIRAVPEATPNPLLTMLNNSKAGTTLSYQTGKLALMLPVVPDVVLIGSSHNAAAQTAADHVAEIESFITAARGYAPDAAVVIVGQNPRVAPASNITAHAQRVIALREFARVNGYGYLPLYENFIGRSDGGKLITDTDGIHPTGAASTLIEDLTVGYEFAADKAVADLALRSRLR